MVYKFLILSDEVDHFAREIEIDSEATFLELNDAILESVGYAKDQLTSFFICEDNWEKKIEVTLMDMETGYDEDSWVMGETRLSELLEDEINACFRLRQYDRTRILHRTAGNHYR